MKKKMFTTIRLGDFAAVLFVLYTFFYAIFGEFLGATSVYIIELVSVFCMMCELQGVSLNEKLTLKKSILQQMSGWFVFLFLFIILWNALIRNGSYFTPIRWIWIIFMMLAIAHRPNVHNTLYKCIFVCGLINVVATIYFYLNKGAYSVMYNVWGYWPSGTKYGTLGYKAGLCNHYSQNGIVLAVFFLAIAALWITNANVGVLYKKNKNKWIYALMILSLGCILLTTKRAHLLFSVSAVLVTYYLGNAEKRAGRLFKIIVVVFSGLLLLYLASYFVPELSSVLERLSTMGEDTESQSRFKFWRIAFSMFRESPIIGKGLGGYRYEYNNYLDGAKAGIFGFMDAHNVYIQLLGETGIVGLTVFLGILLSAFKKCLKIVTSKNMKVLYSPMEQFGVVYATEMLVFFCLYCLTGNCFYDITFGHFAVALGIVYSINVRKEEM